MDPGKLLSWLVNSERVKSQLEGNGIIIRGRLNSGSEKQF